MQKHHTQKMVFTSRRMEQQWVRTQGVKMMREGFRAKEVAELFNVSIRAVYGWVAAFSEFGLQGLQAKEGAGRPPKVSPEQMQWIATTVRDHTPDQLRFEFGLWTLRLIGQVIERELGLTLSRPTLGKIMNHLGFTPQRPLRRAYEQDAVLVEDWLKSRLPALRRRAKRRGAALLFADEASMRSDYHAGTTWAPQGQTPIVKATGKRHSINMISAVSMSGELQFMLIDGKSNAHVFKGFLEQLMLGTDQPIMLVVDGHSIHRAKLINEYVDSTDGMLELHYLPPYSPQLNPDEQVWKNIKERVAKKPHSTKQELRDFLVESLVRLQNMPELVRGFFRHPECGFVK